MREAAGDGAEAGPQLGDLVAVLVERAALGVAQRTVDQRVLLRRRVDPERDLGPAEDRLALGQAQLVGVVDVVGDGVVELDARPLGPGGATGGFAPDDERDVDAATDQVEVGVVEECLLRDAGADHDRPRAPPAPTERATSRAASRYFHEPSGTATRSTRRSSPGAPQSSPAAAAASIIRPSASLPAPGWAGGWSARPTPATIGVRRSR